MQLRVKSNERFIVSNQPYILHLVTVHDSTMDRWFTCFYQADGHKLYIEEEVGGPGGVLKQIADTNLHTCVFQFIDSSGLLKEPFLPTGLIKQRNV